MTAKGARGDMAFGSNPFRPSFGVSPRVLAGRAGVIDDFDIALDEGPGSPMRTVLVSGARGMGKTVVLNELEDRARSRGWWVLRLPEGERLVSTTGGGDWVLCRDLSRLSLAGRQSLLPFGVVHPIGDGRLDDIGRIIRQVGLGEEVRQVDVGLGRDGDVDRLHVSGSKWSAYDIVRFRTVNACSAISH